MYVCTQVGCSDWNELLLRCSLGIRASVSVSSDFIGAIQIVLLLLLLLFLPAGWGWTPVLFLRSLTSPTPSHSLVQQAAMRPRFTAYTGRRLAACVASLAVEIDKTWDGSDADHSTTQLVLRRRSRRSLPRCRRRQRSISARNWSRAAHGCGAHAARAQI